MKVEELASELERRFLIVGKQVELTYCLAYAKLIIDYELKLTMDNFTSRGLAIVDGHDRSVSVYPTTIAQGYMRSDIPPYTDIIVIESQGMILGWTTQAKVTTTDLGFAGNLKSLTAMPSEFRFSQVCPHLSVYGGVWHQDAKSWECFGCDQLLPDLIS